MSAIDTRREDASDALQVVGPAWAWAFSPGWRGSPELLAHIAQAAVHALRDESPELPTCRIRVRVDDDTERFNSPRALRHDITTDALRRFDAIDMKITSGSVKIAVTLVRKLDQARVRQGDEARPWLRRGLLVEVSDDSRVRRRSGDEDLVTHLVGDVLSAVRRGVSRDVLSRVRRRVLRRDEIQRGNDRQRTTAREDYVRRREERRRRHFLAAGFTVLAVLVYVGLLKLLGSDSAPGEGSDSLLSVAGPTALGAALGALPFAFLLWVRPTVEVSDVTRAQKVTRATLKAVGPVIGGGLALAARLLA